MIDDNDMRNTKFAGIHDKKLETVSERSLDHRFCLSQLVGFALLALLALFSSSTVAWSGHLIEGEYWIGPNYEVALNFPEKKEVFYFSSRKDGACFTFKLKGFWAPGVDEQGWLIGSNPPMNVGVLLLSERESSVGSRDRHQFSGLCNSSQEYMKKDSTHPNLTKD